MARQNNIESQIPALYRRSALNLLMFGYVTGARTTLHTVTIKQAIMQFMEDYSLTDEDYSPDSALVTFSRMQKELKLTKNH